LPSRPNPSINFVGSLGARPIKKPFPYGIWTSRIALLLSRAAVPIGLDFDSRSTCSHCLLGFYLKPVSLEFFSDFT
jgi:hypothetical protein